MENTVKSTSGNSLQQVDSNKMEPLLIITPHHDISDNNRHGLVIQYTQCTLKLHVVNKVKYCYHKTKSVQPQLPPK